ncbi:MAG: ABC transporter ATP-binding protein [Nitrososphaerota archaeon]|nr:ABC transporter ATP-binding protein [Candidatus Bathyarchaeota archaeon]MDW8024208.1 ABC transporter ATP-binding protein [Nitrososphaerota archaeon]
MLEVKDVDIAYGSALAVTKATLTVNKNETVVIVGRNGAGKTTLLRTIAGFLKPVKGTIVFNRVEITKLTPHQIARLGIRYVIQEKRVFSDLTVRENLELAAYATGDWDGINRVLEFFPRLKKLLNNKARGLSGGERQMLLLARAMIGDLKLLMIDEPTEGLAPAFVEFIQKVLEDFKAKTSMIIVEQNLPLASKLADKIYVMKEGKIVYEEADKGNIKNIKFKDYL